MAISCSEITKNLARDCDLVLAQGLKETIYVGRIDWLSGVTKFGKKITAITMKSGKKLLHVEGAKLSNQLTVGFTETDYVNLMPHVFRFIAFTNSAADKAEIDQYLTLNDIFIISKQNGLTGQWEASGLDTGMKMSAFDYDSNAQVPAYTLTFTAANERGLPYTVEHTTSSVVDTDAYLETLALAFT